MAQTIVGSTTDLQVHKFQPQGAPEQAADSASMSDRTAGANGISHFAANQMQALQREKYSRTPAQQKIDSNILYTERMLQGQEAAPGVPFLNTGVDLDANNHIVVDMVANVTDSLLSSLSAAGAKILYSNVGLRSIRATIPPDKIEEIAALPDVIFISPQQESRHSGRNIASRGRRRAGYASGTWICIESRQCTPDAWDLAVPRRLQEHRSPGKAKWEPKEILLIKPWTRAAHSASMAPV